jgi:hypothetical protein
MSNYFVCYENDAEDRMGYTVEADDESEAWSIAEERFNEDNADGHLDDYDLEGVYYDPN